MYRAANCTCRSLLSRVPVILPKFGSPRTLSGWLYCAQLKMLNASRRSSAEPQRGSGTVLKSERSTVRVGGPVTALRDSVPCDPAAGLNAAVLNHSLVCFGPLFGLST